jgi:uncharacterized repeat protein (TIGR01451 family)
VGNRLDRQVWTAPSPRIEDDMPAAAVLRIKPSRSLVLVVVIAVAMTATMVLLARQAAASITDTFTGRFQANTNGSIILRGNANLVCPTAASGCTAGRNGTATGGALNNNAYVMRDYDTDSDATTFNESSSAISLPSGSTVLFAGLYWSADPTKGAGSGSAAARTTADTDKVLFRTPAGPTTWNNVTAQKTFTHNGINAYQGFKDVTPLVSGAGNGVYTVANIQAGTGQDRYAGWALVIAYSNPSEPMHSLRVYDGFGVVKDGDTRVDIAATGFTTPHNGTVGATIGTVVYEGDRGLTGDSLQVSDNNGASFSTMSDAVNPADNFFNSTVSETGAIVSGRTPGYDNLMGVDIDRFDASGKLGNDKSAATLRLTTGGETFYPGVVTFTTDLFSPNVITTPTGVDLNGGDLLPGDVIEYRIDVRNDGTDTANNVVVTDAVPTSTTYVPGSLTVTGGAATDAADADKAKFAGSTATFDAGSLAPGATKRVTFQVKVAAGTLPGTAIVTMTVQQPHADLAAVLSVAPATVQRNTAPASVAYTATVQNNGTDTEPAAKAKLTLPAGVTAGTLPAGCTAAGQVVTCSVGPVGSGSSSSVTIPATAAGSAATQAQATLEVSGAGLDGTPANDTTTATLRVNSAPVATADPGVTTTNATKVNINVKANDSDPDGDFLNVGIASPAAHGLTNVESDGTVSYTPDSTWVGTDTFTYKVFDGRGGNATATVTVNTANAAPAAKTDNYSTSAGVAVTVSPKDNDPDANNQALHLVAVGQPQSGAGSTVLNPDGTVTYTPDPLFLGTADFTYVVADTMNAQTTGTVHITVANAGPAAIDDTANVAYHGGVTIDVLHNDTDDDGDPLTITSVSTPASGGAAAEQSGKIDYQAPTGFSGDDTFTYTISDGHGGTATATVTVTVGNAAPTANPQSLTTNTNTPLPVDALSSASDPNATDHLTVSGTTAPLHGRLVLNADQSLTYTPRSGYAGPDSFDYTVDDGHGGTATGTISITVSNAAPVATADAVSVPAGVVSTVNVLANDRDANNDPLTVTITGSPAHGTATVNADGTVRYTPAAGFVGTDTFAYQLSDGPATATATATLSVVNSAPVARPDADSTDADNPVTLSVLANDTDPNNDTLTVTAATAPPHGQVVVTANGTITYTPAAGFAGTDSFSYTVADPSGATDTGIVTVTVRSSGPIAVNDSYVARPGVAMTLDVLANDTDPNTGQTLSVATVGTGSKGTVTLHADGTLTYLPTATGGIDSFDYVLTDTLGLTDTATVTVTITIDAAPNAVADTASTVSGVPVVISVLSNDSDAESGQMALVSATTPGHGTAVLVGGQIRYTPATGFTGTDTFNYTMRDTVGNTATASVTVQVANAAPVADGITAAVLANHSVDIAARSGQTLTVSQVGTPAHGTAVIVDGKIRYTPAIGYVGTDTFTYTVTDGNGGTATAGVTVTVSDGTPVAVADDRTTPYQKAITIPVLANDLDPNGELAITSVTSPDNGTVAFTSTELVYTPPAGFSGKGAFTYTATDANAQETTATVTVTVGTPPAVPDKTATAKPGTPVKIALPTVDENGKPVTVTSVGMAKHGTVKLNDDGTVTYTPDDGYTGADSFSYSVVDADGNVASASIEVTVTGANKAPVAANDRVSVVAGGSVVIRPKTNDTDPDGDKITITRIGRPRHGTAVLNANGTVTYAPVDGYLGGTDSLSYTISDGHGGTATATVTIVVTAATTTGGGGGGGKLALTGENVVSVATTGMLVLLIGGALVWFGQRGIPVPVALTGRGQGRHRPGRHR